MTDRLYAKYMWLISTIYDAGKISFEDIACKWDKAYRRRGDFPWMVHTATPSPNQIS